MSTVTADPDTSFPLSMFGIGKKPVPVAPPPPETPMLPMMVVGTALALVVASLLMSKKKSRHAPRSEPVIYMWPPKEGHSEDLVMGSPVSLPCRVAQWTVVYNKLPVDLVGIDFAKDLRSPEALETNPIHSVPWLVAYSGSTKTGINGSEALCGYLCDKYRDLVPETFLPSDPIQKAKVMEVFNFIYTVCYRATMYQYVYPAMGLMSECQYDICKRDFALDQVEAWAKAVPGPFFFGNWPTLADFTWASLFLGNSWTKDEHFKMEWKHSEVIAKYPHSKKVIDAVLALPAIAAHLKVGYGENCPDIITWNDHVTKMIMAHDMPGTGRKFNRYPDGPTVHPNDVSADVGGSKAKFDMPLP